MLASLALWIVTVPLNDWVTTLLRPGRKQGRASGKLSPSVRKGGFTVCVACGEYSASYAYFAQEDRVATPLGLVTRNAISTVYLIPAAPTACK